ncbi:MAG: diaminopimelate epimerase [Planctomycetota bacterium]
MPDVSAGFRFVKMHGAGNDYVYVDASAETLPSDLPALARRVSNRHFGIGGDGLIVVHPPTKPDEADVRMQMFNIDGSEGSMCGNGIRCVAKFAVDEGLVQADATRLRVDTASGIKEIDLIREAGEVAGATVDMGRPGFGVEAVGADPTKLAVDETHVTPVGLARQAVLVSTGNPHAVVFVGDLDDVDVPSEGPAWSGHEAFGGGINAHFAQVLSRNHLRVIHWERGSGPTLACGTGACATLAAAVRLGLADRSARLDVPGGRLDIRWDEGSDHLFMSGPAETTFHGTWAG